MVEQSEIYINFHGLSFALRIHNLQCFNNFAHSSNRSMTVAVMVQVRMASTFWQKQMQQLKIYIMQLFDQFKNYSSFLSDFVGIVLMYIDSTYVHKLVTKRTTNDDQNWDSSFLPSSLARDGILLKVKLSRMKSSTTSEKCIESRYPVSTLPIMMAVRPIGKLLNKEATYRSGQPKTKREANACPKGMKMK